ncbi:MAG TPA: GGDEF domain-containing protein [Gammaproteobacteria bacterium]|nr:GGDEF domain-containing protein [Gammaproteobacteria bacterium]
METRQRRAGDRRRGPTDRRAWRERRSDQPAPDGLRFPGWPEQVVQFLTRYLFVALGLAFFNLTTAGTWMGPTGITSVFGLYFLVNTVFFVHARRHPVCPGRYRLAMWVDIAMVSVAMLNDPYPIPPSALVYIMVVLGNGMRYGLRLFGEALAGSFGAALAVLAVRHVGFGSPLTDGAVFLALFAGIILLYAYILMSRIEATRRQLEHSSKLDGLTGLMNRRALEDIAQVLFSRLDREDATLVVMFADMDKFKQVNDTHGHAMGDRVLRRLAGILRANVRAGDVAARYGGDEFVLLLSDTDTDRAETVARRLQDKIKADAAELGLQCSITIGIGAAPAHGRSLEQVLEKVDQALYDGKADRTRGGIVRVGAAGGQRAEPAA